MSTSQINLRFSNELLKTAKKYAKVHGYLNLQEFIREVIRERVFDEGEIRTNYLKKLQSREATTFLSEKESKKFHEEMKRKAGMK